MIVFGSSWWTFNHAGPICNGPERLRSFMRNWFPSSRHYLKRFWWLICIFYCFFKLRLSIMSKYFKWIYWLTWRWIQKGLDGLSSNKIKHYWKLSQIFVVPMIVDCTASGGVGLRCLKLKLFEVRVGRKQQT